MFKITINALGKSVLFVAILSFFQFASNAQTTITVGSGMNWVGYMNVFDSVGTGWIFGSGWAVADMKTEVDTVTGAMTLKPNYNTYADNPGDPFWQNGAIGNKVMEANTFVESTSLGGQELTFEGYVDSFSLDPGYQATAFIKVLDPALGYAAVVYTTVPLLATGAFSVTDSIPSTPGLITQYGFTVYGMNANPVDEAAFGNVHIRGDYTPMVDVTLQVQAAPASEVYVQGNWDWGIWPGIAMTSAAGDIYEATLTLPADSTIEYKYVIVDGGDTTQEDLDETLACTNGNATYTNRMTTLGSDDTTLCARWATCDDCFPVSVNELEQANLSVNVSELGIMVNSDNLTNLDAITIYDLTGRQIYSVSDATVGQFIPANLSTGVMYLISIQNDGAVKSFKAVIQ